MMRVAPLVALVAAAVGVGIYFGARGGPSKPLVPRAQQSAVLDEAKRVESSRGIES